MTIHLPAGASAKQLDIVSERVFYQFAWSLIPPPAPGGQAKLVFVTPQGEAVAFLLDPVALAQFRRDTAAPTV